MKAIVVTPREKDSARMIEVENPEMSADEVLVRVIRVGIDGTDAEINEGLYGDAPVGDRFLIIGHESFGVVEKVGENVRGFKKGDFVVATVRRPCGGCVNCAGGESDMCLTGKFKERGISGLHGFMTEFYVEVPDFLVRVPFEFEDIGVFLEPLSILEKAFSQILMIQNRLAWRPRTALVLGSGSIGLLATMLLQMRGLTTYTVARGPDGCLKSQIAAACGANYVSANETSISKFPQKIGNIDLIIEATGSSRIAFEAMQILGTNGVLCLTSITGGKTVMQVPSDKINLELVLGNKLIFGTVNSNRKHFETGVDHFRMFNERWPGLIRKMITRRCALKDFRDAITRDVAGIKNVMEVTAV